MRFWRWLLVPWVLPVALPIWLLFILPALLAGLIDRYPSMTVRSIGAPVMVFAVRSPDTRLGRWWRSKWVTDYRAWIGMALPMCVILRAEIADKVILRHEIRHTDQWLVLGIFFPVAYMAMKMIYGYEDHPLEKDARRWSARGMVAL